MAGAPLRLVGGLTRRARHAPPPCPKAFGSGTDDGEIAERKTADKSVIASLRSGAATLLTLPGYFG